jgi:phosphatidylglycerophosphatase A
MSDNNYHKIGNAPLFHVILSTGLGTGFVPIAPGTAGAVLALIVWLAMYWNFDAHTLLFLTLSLILITTVIGVWTSNVMEKYWGKDPRAVNIDEFVGTWIPLLLAPCGQHTLMLSLVGFVAFRMIDIYKPLGCRWIDQNVPGGWGVMLDDILAGLYALVIVAFVRFLIVII